MAGSQLAPPKDNVIPVQTEAQEAEIEIKGGEFTAEQINVAVAEMHIEDHDHEHRFHFTLNVVITLAQLGAAIGLFAWLLPQTFAVEAAGGWKILLWALAFGVPISLFEYLYHRYFLHSQVLPFLGHMHDSHVHHHSLTNVKAPVTPKDPEKLVPVESEYPIEHEHQEDSMQFPYFATSVFNLIFVGTIAVPMKLLFPNEPLVLGMLVAATSAYLAYELWHAVLHFPFKRYWKPAMAHRVWGRMVKRIYAFHLMHHLRPTCNLAVVGLWGWAVWDHLFKTHLRPVNLPLQGSKINFNDVRLDKPAWPIRFTDMCQKHMVRFARKVDAKFFKKHS